jgi:excisionase family DNA binding protein
MKLSIDQAATHLGKSARQVRYLIKTGRLKAQQEGKRWLIDSADLPLTEAQHKAVERKERQLHAAVEEGLGLDAQEARPPRFSVRDIKAYQVGMPLRRRCAALLGEEHRAVAALTRSLELLAIGCHHDGPDKAAAYAEARDYASRALLALLLEQTPEADALAEAIEQELMGPFAGLLKRIAGGRRRA